MVTFERIIGLTDEERPITIDDLPPLDLGAAQTKPAPLAWLDMSTWDSETVPERQWAIRDRVPLKQAGLFSGEGGTGKSLIEIAKNVAHVTSTGGANPMVSHP